MQNYKVCLKLQLHKVLIFVTNHEKLMYFLDIKSLQTSQVYKCLFILVTKVFDYTNHFYK